MTRCAYAAELEVKMADEEAEQERSERSDASSALNALTTRLEDIAAPLKNSQDSPDERASQYCYEFCQVSADCPVMHRSAARTNTRHTAALRSNTALDSALLYERVYRWLVSVSAMIVRISWLLRASRGTVNKPQTDD